MKLSGDQQRELNDKSWTRALQTGQVIRGNLQVNLKFLEQTGLLRPAMEILEVGCGAGNLCELLYQQGLAITGCDVSEVAIQHGRGEYPHLDLSARNAEQLLWEKESFDAVISFDVLEHLFNLDDHLMEVRRVLKSGGYYLLGTPNKLINAVFETMKNRSFEWRRYHPSLHFSGQLKRRLIKHGFEVRFVKMNTVNEFTLKKLDTYPWLKKLAQRLDFRYLPLWMQTNFYVIAQKEGS
jgi:2-polyprenyl-3-methyl-5-hydroxy-6-metoxy-1,4-benzoquinol methylase